jgi:DNA-directed RNA polymerase subunit RPC12/RpoP
VLGKKIRCKGCGHTFAARAEDEDEPGPAKAPGKAAKNGPGKAPAKAPPAKAKAPAKAEEKPRGGEDEPEDDANPYGLTYTDLSPRCPDCANEMESEDAIICLHCGYNTVTREKSKPRKVRDVTGGDVFLWLLPGILCVIGVVVLLVSDIIYCVKIGDWVDTETWYGATLAHLAIKIWMVVISLFIIYKLGYFAVVRLCIHNKPPEIEEKWGA